MPIGCSRPDCVGDGGLQGGVGLLHNVVVDNTVVDVGNDIGVGVADGVDTVAVQGCTCRRLLRWQNALHRCWLLDQHCVDVAVGVHVSIGVGCGCGGPHGCWLLHYHCVDVAVHVGIGVGIGVGDWCGFGTLHNWWLLGCQCIDVDVGLHLGCRARQGHRRQNRAAQVHLRRCKC